MAVLSKYELFVEKRKIKFMCDKFALSNYTINDDLTVDVDRSVWMQSKYDDMGLIIKLPFKFGTVNGLFDVSKTNIYNFENFPNLIKGTLLINNTKITSLEGMPKIENLGGVDLNIKDCKIKDLSPVPKGLNVIANDTKLTYITDTIPVSFDNTPIYNLIIELDYLFMKTTNYQNEKKEQLNLQFREWIERLNEFEVIKNIDELDLISMNSLFDFYKQPFGAYEIQRIKFNSKGYKIIE